MEIRCGFAFNVIESKDHAPVTYIRTDDSISIDNMPGLLQENTIPIFDKIGPLIVYKKIIVANENKRSPLIIDNLSDTIPDTLVVTFSEPVYKVNHAAPFHFLSINV